jgi:hypothetical protein
VGLVVAGALAAPIAHAGSYDVYSCAVGGVQYPNNAWHVQSNPAGDARYTTKTSCSSPTDPLEARLTPGNTFGAGTTFAGLEFAAPGGTTISDFSLDVHHVWNAPPSNQTYSLTDASNGAVAGAGQFSGSGDAGPNWYATSGTVDKRVTLTRANTNAAGRAAPTWLTISSGCDNAAGCTLDAAGTVVAQLFGARVTISDPVPPTLTSYSTDGLFAPGVRDGNESVTVTATDNVGIRRLELVDVTDAANPVVVASQDYDLQPTKNLRHCDYTATVPCPNISGQSIAPAQQLAGRRTIIVRVTDSGGNLTVSSPTVVIARGPLNGVNGSEAAKLLAGFPGRRHRGHGKHRRTIVVLRSKRTVAYGSSATVRGVLRNSAGQPIVGAQLRLLIRDLKLGAHYADRGAVTTGPDGHFGFKIPHGASRRVRIVYRAYPGDANPTAKSDLLLNTKAKITASATPHHVRPRGIAVFHGRLVGRPLPPHGVTLELQAHQPGRGWRTVKTTRTRRGGRYSTAYRFNSFVGHFAFRLRLRPSDSYPYALATSRPVRVRVG